MNDPESQPLMKAANGDYKTIDGPQKDKEDTIDPLKIALVDVPQPD